MANAFYPPTKTRLLQAVDDYSTGNFKVALLSSAYTYNVAHDFANDLTGIVATSGNLAGVSVTGAVFDANDITLTAVTGSTIVAYAIYRDTGSSATSPLVVYVDTTPSATAISLVPNGGDITVTFDNGTNRIFKVT